MTSSDCPSAEVGRSEDRFGGRVLETSGSGAAPQLRFEKAPPAREPETVEVLEASPTQERAPLRAVSIGVRSRLSRPPVNVTSRSGWWPRWYRDRQTA